MQRAGSRTRLARQTVIPQKNNTRTDGRVPGRKRIQRTNQSAIKGRGATKMKHKRQHNQKPFHVEVFSLAEIRLAQDAVKQFEG